MKPENSETGILPVFSVFDETKKVLKQKINILEMYNLEVRPIKLSSTYYQTLFALSHTFPR